MLIEDTRNSPVETSLYYCNSRYYDPKIRRWISPDSIEYLDPQSINELNLYTYCGNDPVNRFDSSGHSWESFWKGVGDWFSDHWKEVVIGTTFIVGGALVTALTAGVGVGFMAAFGSALLSSTIQIGISVGTSVLVGGSVSIANGGGFRIDTGAMLGLHMHILSSGHLPIGAVIAGFIGTGY